MAECRPKNYPKLKDYKPSRFMLPTCHYDAAKADRAVTFIENLRHTKGKWAGKRFWLLPWQEQIIRDVFGIVDERGNRQFRTAYVEIGKKNGKSELAAAVALYLLFADNEPSAEVYGAAADRQQASIVFDVAHQMVQMTPALLKRCKIMAATKRIVNYGNAGFYQVLSAEVGTKHGLNVSGLVLDEVHAQPNRKLYDVLTKGSGDAREQPLFFLITTAGTDKESICYELHMKALDLLAGRKIDHTFYPVVYGLTDEDDWHDEANWYKANPSLGQTIQIQRVRDAYQEALDNPAEENVFKQLRLNMWVSSLTRFIPEHIYNLGNQPIDMEALKGRDCYGGLDLSSTGDITAFVLMFPPRIPLGLIPFLQFRQTGKAGTEGRNTRHDHCTADRRPVHSAAGHLCHDQSRAGLEHRLCSTDAGCLPPFCTHQILHSFFLHLFHIKKRSCHVRRRRFPAAVLHFGCSGPVP